MLNSLTKKAHKMKKLFAIIAVAGFLAACNSGSTPAATADSLKKDSTKVDSVKVDTAKVAVDSTKKDSTKK
jgi:hypothetical protein